MYLTVSRYQRVRPLPQSLPRKTRNKYLLKEKSWQTNNQAKKETRSLPKQKKGELR